MTDSTIFTLLVIAMVAVLSPVIAELTRRIGPPSIVIEIALGIVIGPSVLGLAHPGLIVNGLSDMGLSFLMFLAGYELNFHRIMGRPLRRALIGWVLSVGLALAAASVLVLTSVVLRVVVVALCLCTTSLGTLLPILGDAGVLETRFGSYVMGIGAVGEFGPIVAVAVLLVSRDPVTTAGLLVLFLAIAVGAAMVSTQVHPPAVVRVLHRNLQTSTQLPVRIAVLLIVALVFIALKLGLDVLLGAFAAGVLVKLLLPEGDTEIIGEKLEAVGYGLLVPVFFIVSGMTFDLRALLTQPLTLLRLPLFVLLLLLVRGVPAALLYRSDVVPLRRGALALLSSTALPLIVAITAIATSAGKMRPVTAAALVGAGMISVLLFPAISLRWLRATEVVAAGDASIAEVEMELEGATDAERPEIEERSPAAEPEPD